MKLFKLNFSNSIRTGILTMIAILSSNISFSQDFGADVVSSYVWRGTQFGSGAHVQPWMELGSGNFTAGVWGSFPTTAQGGGEELDMYIGYDFGPFALTLTNYTFPQGDGEDVIGMGTYLSSEGLFDGTYTEISASTSLGGIDFLAGYFTELESLYLEASFAAGPVGVAIGYADDQGDSWYAGGGSGIVNMSFSGSKDIQITDDYSLPVFGSFIYNPDAETAFLVFGVNF
ncbi:MAG: hypothetical protein ACJ0OU_04725 [Candidatus Marisimplicoccus sp.]|jgi:hypothetical protein|tara:strand:- start:9454 stop:10143 length:690 start_codon:yes stop_codon:yes gene_type:complete